MDQSGLATWIGGGVAALSGVPTLVIIAAVALLVVFLTELTSNVATTSMAMPVMAGAAVALALEPLTLMTTAAVAASMAFMLPVATPPNAIVFASGYISIPQMGRAGFVLNLCSVVIISLPRVDSDSHVSHAVTPPVDDPTPPSEHRTGPHPYVKRRRG